MVEVWRGDIVESQHVGAGVVANAKGEIIAGWGDPNVVTYPRSAMKPVQAIALVETGAAAAYGLNAEHIALSCASHRAEPFQTALVTQWLATLGLDQSALACGPDRPVDVAAADAAVLAGQPKQRIFHNCSGKHCGFLTVARHRGWSLDYADPQHPAQQLYLDALSEFTCSDAHSFEFGIDGCTLPAPAMSLATFAKMLARFSTGKASTPGRAQAVNTIMDAMRAHPGHLAGADQPAAHLARATRGRLLMKTGAEGFISVFVPGQGLAIALKIADGEPRGRVPALIAALSAAGMLDVDEQKALASLAMPAVTDSMGTVVGRIAACGFTGR